MKKEGIAGVSAGSATAGFDGILRRRPGVLIFIFAAAATVTSIFFIDFCAAVFRCGCVSLWSGADVHCNIHMAGGRHCPWCVHGLAASTIPWALIVAVQAGVSFWPRPMSTGLRLVSAIVAFPAAGGAIAVAYGLSEGYWK